jgi:MtN3 and saliva related transmembrane protein
MNNTTIVGVIASIFTGVSLLPQLVKIIKEKNAGDISAMMLTVLFIGLGIWIYYGFLIKDWIIMISNSISLLINSGIMILTLKYKNR